MDLSTSLDRRHPSNIVPWSYYAADITASTGRATNKQTIKTAKYKIIIIIK